MTYADSIVFGTSSIHFLVITSPRRKKAGIAVYPDKTVELVVPPNTSQEKAREIIRKKAGWIFEQLEWFDHLTNIDASKEYVGGETFLYLGRQYRLKIICNGSGPAVRLRGGYFEVTIPEVTANKDQDEVVRKALWSWYRHHALLKVGNIIEKFTKRMGIEAPQYSVKHQLKRWGSCTKDGHININIRIAMAPSSQFEYVVAHELCHLRYKDHSSDFWYYLRRIMPDYEIRKDQLLKDGWKYAL